MTGAAQISATFDWHRTRFTVTGWAEARRWISLSSVVVHMAARADGDDVRAVVQAAGVVSDFLGDLAEAARTDSDRAPTTLQDFAEGLTRTPLSAASALGGLLAAMAAAEAPAPVPVSAQSDKESADGDRS